MVRKIEIPKTISVTSIIKNGKVKEVWGDDILSKAICAAINRSPYNYVATSHDKQDYINQYDYNINMYSHRDIDVPEKNGNINIYYLQVPREEIWLEETMERFDGILYASQHHYNKHREQFGGILFHMSADQEVFKFNDGERNGRVVFVGNYGLRSNKRYEKYLTPLLDLPNLDIYGAEWFNHPDERARSKWKGILPPDQLPSMYAKYTVAISIHSDAHSSEDVKMITTRPFEAVSCGAIVVGDEHSMHPELSIQCKDGEEILELIEDVLKDDHPPYYKDDQKTVYDYFIDNATFDVQVPSLISYLESL